MMYVPQCSTLLFCSTIYWRSTVLQGGGVETNSRNDYSEMTEFEQNLNDSLLVEEQLE